MVIFDANAEAIRASLQSAESQRWMMRVAAPQLIVLDYQLLDMGSRQNKVQKRRVATKFTSTAVTCAVTPFDNP
jgi:hypothetical protein